MLREHEGGVYSHVLLSVGLGHGIVHDTGRYTEEDRPAQGVAPEAKKVPRPLEGLGRGDGHEAKVSQGEPLTYVSFSWCWYFRQVDVEHVRDTSSQGSSLRSPADATLPFPFEESSA